MSQISDPNTLFRELLSSHRTGDMGRFIDLCEGNRETVFRHYRTWAVIPYQIQNEQPASEAYAKGIVAVAEFFAHKGDFTLLKQLDGQGEDDPIQRWDKAFREFEEVMKTYDFAEARELLQQMAKEMRELSGPGVDFRLPYVHERLAWLYFLTGDLESAELHGRAALTGYEKMDHTEGILTISRRLADIFKASGETKTSRYWIVRFTNLLIASGRVENAIPVRKLHGIQPEDQPIDLSNWEAD